MNLNDLAKNFSDPDKARTLLEKMRWPDGVICPHCGVVGEAYRLVPKKGAKTHVRPGVWKCGSCREQFTVTVGTIFEDSHIPLNKWLMAIHLLCASKKGMSAHQLHRMLGVTYKSAWFMAHRIRYAMSQNPSDKLLGTIEADETYIGGKSKGGPGMPSLYSNKSPVMSLVEREGRVRSFHMQSYVTSKNLKKIVDEQVDKRSSLITDDSRLYPSIGRSFASHRTVNHSAKEYARVEGKTVIHTNTVEGYFSILKRGINGVYHHVGKRHLHRYLSEFDFRYNSREATDGERAESALRGFAGKRLTYKAAN